MAQLGDVMHSKSDLEKRTAHKGALNIVRGFCAQCTNGPHPINCYVVNGVLTKVELNRELAPYAYCQEGRPVCARLNLLVQKVYNPHRVKSPMKRTNPEKGRDIDPKWQEIGWDEALAIVSNKLHAIRQKGLRDENGHPRLAVHPGSAGVSSRVGRSFFAWWHAWGPTDSSFNAGGSIRCYHAEHYYGEMWHRSFMCNPDPDHVKWLLSFGRNDYSNWSVTGQHLKWRAGDFKRIQVDPHLTTTGAASDEWIPIKPMTDLALILAMAHTILHEMDWHKVCDIDFLKNMTNSPYLIGPHGYYVRDKKTKKPLIWDPTDGKAMHIDDKNIQDYALEGKYRLNGVEVGPDEESWTVSEGTPSFQLLVDSTKNYTPEWAAKICDVEAQIIRRLAREYVKNAMVGSTIKMAGKVLPYRPVCIEFGKNTANGPGSYQVELVYHILACLVGALEVPGSHISSKTYIAPGPPERDQNGFLGWPPLPTGKESWPWPPDVRCGVRTLCPVIGISLFTDMLGPNHLTWMGVDEGGLPNWPVSVPDAIMTFHSNAPISVLDPERVERVLGKIPFHVRIAYEFDEAANFADILLPESIDVEATQIWLTDATKCLTEYLLLLGRFPAVKPFNTMELTDICTELSARVGILAEFNEALNKGAVSNQVPLLEADWLKPDQKYTATEIYERVARAMTNNEHGLEDFEESGGYALPYPLRFEGVRLHSGSGGWIRPWYLYPFMAERRMRFELPYQARLKKMSVELATRLHEKDIYWWDKQVEEYVPLPAWRDTAKLYDNGPEYDLWVVTGHSGKFQWSTVSNPMYLEIVERSLEHLHIQINSEAAAKRGIKDEDEIYVESAHGRVKGRAKLREGLRPDTIVLHGQFGHWATPVAREAGKRLPNITALSRMDLNLMAEDGGVRDTVKAKVYKITT
ncbi:molybdopterin-dependent oxidoreductase [Chloroflexota bacterium]